MSAHTTPEQSNSAVVDAAPLPAVLPHTLPLEARFAAAKSNLFRLAQSQPPCSAATHAHPAAALRALLGTQRTLAAQALLDLADATDALSCAAEGLRSSARTRQLALLKLALELCVGGEPERSLELQLAALHRVLLRDDGTHHSDYKAALLHHELYALDVLRKAQLDTPLRPFSAEPKHSSCSLWEEVGRVDDHVHIEGTSKTHPVLINSAAVRQDMAKQAGLFKGTLAGTDTSHTFLCSPIKKEYVRQQEGLVLEGGGEYPPLTPTGEVAHVQRCFASALQPPRACDSELEVALDYNDFARVGTWNIWGLFSLRSKAANAAEAKALAAASVKEAAQSAATTPVVTRKQALSWGHADNKALKLECLGRFLCGGAEGGRHLTVCALQEVHAAAALPAALLPSSLPAWRFLTSACIGLGMLGIPEAALFGYDSLAWEPLCTEEAALHTAAAVYQPPQGQSSPFVRSPAALFLRSRVHAPRVLALVSSHHKSDGSRVDHEVVVGEAAALASHALPWVREEAQRRGVRQEDLTIAFAGDYNLAPPTAAAVAAARACSAGVEGGGASTAASAAADAGAAAASPWAALLRAGFTPALTADSAAAMAATNVVKEFTATGEEMAYDNIFSSVGVREARVVDTTKEPFSSAAVTLSSVVAVNNSIKALAAGKELSKHGEMLSFVQGLEKALLETKVFNALRQRAFRDFRSTVSDHRPVRATLCAGLANA